MDKFFLGMGSRWVVVMAMCMATLLVPNLASATATQGYPAYFTLSSVDAVSGYCSGTYQTLAAAEAGCAQSYPWDGPLGAGNYHHEVVSGWAQLSSSTWQLTVGYCQTAPHNICPSLTQYFDNMAATCPNGGAFQDLNGLHVPGWCLIQGTDTSHPPCPTGQILNTQSSQCESLAELNAKLTCDCVGDPMSPGSGNLQEKVTDYKGGGPFPLVFTRTYNSLLANQGFSSLDGADSSMGPGWSSNVGSDARIFVRSYWPLTLCTDNQSNQYACPSTSNPMIEATVWRPDGSQSHFSYTSDTAPAGTELTAEANAEGQLYFDSRGFRYVRADGMSEIYQISGSTFSGTTGKLIAIQDPHGLSQTFAYNYITLIGGIVVLDSVTVTDPAGRQMVEHFDDTASQRVMSITVPALDASTGTATISYAYDSNGNLQTATYQDGSVVTYEYNDARTGLSHAMTGLKDASNNEYTAWSYDASGNAVCSEHAPTGNTPSTATTCSADSGGVDKTMLSYGGTVTVTEPTGLQRNMTFTTVNGTNLLASVDRRCGDCDDIDAAFTYDSNGFPQTVTDFDGNVTDLTISSGLTVLKIEGATTQYQRTTTIPTVNAFNNLLPEQVKLTNSSGALVKQMDYCYNLSGGSCADTTAIGPVWTTTVTDEDPSHAGVSPRTSTYTYNAPSAPGYVAAIATGLLLKVDGPLTGLTDVTTYTYYTSSSPGNYAAGDLESVTDALGHATTINQYSAAGLPIKVTNMNGVVTTFAYDGRGRLTSRTVDAGGTGSIANATTTYVYCPATPSTTCPYGFLHAIDLPITVSGHHYLTYTYDRAHRITDIQNDAGEIKTFTYTYDTQCVMADTSCQTYDIEEQRYASGGGSAVYDRHVTRDDFLDQVRDTDGNGHTTTYQHDANGNLQMVTDALGHPTTRYYDALNRVYEMQDAKGGITTYGLDALDHLTDITSPRGANTGYVYDVFGELLSQHSPDSGSTTNDYSAWLTAAKVASTDAIGTVQTYVFDALQRMVSATNVKSHITYTYDATGSSIGRLYSVTDNSGSTTFDYNNHGTLEKKVVNITGGVLSFTQTYRRDAADNISSIGYPPANGTVVYTLDSMGRPTAVDATCCGTTDEHLARNITYLPFGPVSGLTYGNNLVEIRTFDKAYQLTDINTPGAQVWHYDYNTDGTIHDIVDNTGVSGIPSFSQTFGYDPMQRLVSATGAYGSISIGADPINHPELAYDGDGNRTQMTVNGVTTAYNYDTTNPGERLLSSVTGGVTTNYGYNADGSITSDGTLTYAYDVNKRLAKILQGTTAVVRSGYNYAGQRATKQVSTGNIYGYIYDEDGQLIAELNPDGTILQEDVWLGDRPLVYYQRNINGSGPTSVRYLHVDQLNTARMMTNYAKVIEWNWYGGDPWGTVVENSDFALRFPGQHLDGIGIAQNWMRDYDPQLGRYLESDPIGLNGGVNTYTYVGNNPISSWDQSGLYPGQLPPAPPGYDPKTWIYGRWPNGRPYLMDPNGTTYTQHCEDTGHWRHWDIQDAEGDDLGQWPNNSFKPWPGQVKGLKPTQSPIDPNLDAPEWIPPDMFMPPEGNEGGDPGAPPEEPPVEFEPPAGD